MLRRNAERPGIAKRARRNHDRTKPRLRIKRGCAKAAPANPADRLQAIVAGLNQIALGQILDCDLAPPGTDQRAAREADDIGVVEEQLIAVDRIQRDRAWQRRIVGVIDRTAFRVDGVRLVQDAVIGEVGAKLRQIVVVWRKIDEVVVRLIAVIQHLPVGGVEICDRVIASRDDEIVEPVAAGQAVGTGAAVKGVVAGSGVNRIGAGAAEKAIAAVASQDIDADSVERRVQRIVARRQDLRLDLAERRCAGPVRRRTGLVAGVDNVDRGGERRLIQRIAVRAAFATGDSVGAEIVRQNNGVLIVAAVDAVGVQAAVNRVGASLTKDRVGAFAAKDGIVAAVLVQRLGVKEDIGDPSGLEDSFEVRIRNLDAAHRPWYLDQHGVRQIGRTRAARAVGDSRGVRACNAVRICQDDL